MKFSLYSRSLSTCWKKKYPQFVCRSFQYLNCQEVRLFDKKKQQNEIEIENLRLRLEMCSLRP